VVAENKNVMITKPETTTRATSATKLARLAVEANLLSLPVQVAADQLDVCRETVITDRQELRLRSLTNLSASTEEYWSLEMADIMADVQFLRTKAKTQGKDGLLLQTLDRWLKLVEMNVVKRSITAHVDLSGQAWPNRLALATSGIVAEARRDEVIAMLEALPRDGNPFPTVGRGKLLEGELNV
jgi:hypothetical protein